jgi:hypothetical protein
MVMACSDGFASSPQVIRTETVNLSYLENRSNKVKDNF